MASGFALSAGAAATAEELFAAVDLGPCELVRGEIVMMSPAGFEHGVVTQHIAAVLHAFASAYGLGVVTAAETGFLLSRSPDTVRAPDAAFIKAARVPSIRTVGYFQVAPDLAVEVLSPTDLHDAAARLRAEDKIGGWLQDGSREAWSVDPASRTITVHRPDAPVCILSEADTLSSTVLPGLTIPLAEVFRAADRA